MTQIADQRWTEDSLAQLTVGGPAVFNGTVTIAGTTVYSAAVTFSGLVTVSGGLAGLQSSTAPTTAVTVGATAKQFASITVVPGQTLRVGSLIRVTVEGTCTSSSADTATVLVTAGTAGTTADATAQTWTWTTTGAGSAIPFRLSGDIVVRTLGTTGVCGGTLIAFNNNSTTGLATGLVSMYAGTAATLATTTATKIGLNMTTAGTSVCTIQNATIEVFS